MKHSASRMQFISKSKERVRSFILAYVRRSKRYLDLYGNGEMYDLVHRKTRTKMASLDNDPLVAKKMDRSDQYTYSIQEFCRKSSDNFDCIWLDYCGSFSQPKLDDIAELYNIMEDNGHLFITLFMGRETFIPKGTAREVIEFGTLMAIQKEMMENNISVELISKIKYSSAPKYTKGNRYKTSPSAMIVYGFRWKRLRRKSNCYKFNSIVKTMIDNV